MVNKRKRNKQLHALMLLFLLLILNATSTRAEVVRREIKKTVGFVFVHPPANPAGVVPKGTGFFVGVLDERMPERTFVYFVTVRHVVAGFRELFVRLNLKDSINPQSPVRFEYLPIRGLASDQHNWLLHEDLANDVAVLPWYPGKRFDIAIIDTDMFVTRELIEQENVAEGEEIFFVGLLSQFYGTRRNYPLVRQGHIALMTPEKFPTHEGPAELVIAESQAFGGNSGAPAFLRFGWTRPSGGTISVGNERLFLLGLVKGYLYEKELFPIVETQQEPTPQESAEGKLHMGLAGIVPISKVLDILDSPAAVEHRKRQIQEYLQNKQGQPK